MPRRRGMAAFPAVREHCLGGPAGTTLQANAALARVGGDLQAGSIAAWKGKAPSGLTVVSASQSNLGGRAAYIVAVQMMKSTGIVRVTLDAQTGGVIQSLSGPWAWSTAPEWYRTGLSSPPPAKR